MDKEFSRGMYKKERRKAIENLHRLCDNYTEFMSKTMYADPCEEANMVMAYVQAQRLLLELLKEECNV